MNEILSLQAFQTFTKLDFYQIYVDLFKKVEEKEKIIKQYAVKTNDLPSRVGANKLMENRSTSSIAAEQFANRVRPFHVFPAKEDQKKTLIGSSIVKKLLRDRSIPTDNGKHAYGGSTALENIELINAYSENKIRTVLLQDGTSSILEEKGQHVDALFDIYIILLKGIDEIFNPDILVLMRVPALRKCQNNEMANERINQFNFKLEDISENHGIPQVTVLPTNDIMHNLQDYNRLSYDEFHLSYSNALPFLRNLLISVMMQTSNSLATFRKNFYAGARNNNSRKAHE